MVAMGAAGAWRAMLVVWKVVAVWEAAMVKVAWMAVAKGLEGAAKGAGKAGRVEERVERMAALDWGAAMTEGEGLATGVTMEALEAGLGLDATEAAEERVMEMGVPMGKAMAMAVLAMGRAEVARLSQCSSVCFGIPPNRSRMPTHHRHHFDNMLRRTRRMWSRHRRLSCNRPNSRCHYS